VRVKVAQIVLVLHGHWLAVLSLATTAIVWVAPFVGGDAVGIALRGTLVALVLATIALIFEDRKWPALVALGVALVLPVLVISILSTLEPGALG
jgi:hypothetical protein